VWNERALLRVAGRSAPEISWRWNRQRGRLLRALARERLEAAPGDLSALTDYEQATRMLALEERDRLQASFGEALVDVDALLTPTTATTAPIVESIDQSTTPAHFTRVANLLDYCALALPNGFDRSGLPISFQIICRGYEEALALRIGRAYEHATAWHQATPPDFP
jgi:Asp-tRNA(Asn)/Glu-tRNA(Gln) amidotransferase A subunit family amidase